MLFEWNPSAARRTISLVTRKSRRRHPLSGMKAQIPNLIENLLTRWNPIQQNMGINTSKISISIISINISRLQECATKYQRRLEKRHGPRSETWPLERNMAPGARQGIRTPEPLHHWRSCFMLHWSRSRLHCCEYVWESLMLYFSLLICKIMQFFCRKLFKK